MSWMSQCSTVQWSALPIQTPMPAGWIRPPWAIAARGGQHRPKASLVVDEELGEPPLPGLRVEEVHRPARPAIHVGDAPAAHDPPAADDGAGPCRRADHRRRRFRARVLGHDDERGGEFVPAVGQLDDDGRRAARLGGPDLAHAVERPAQRGHGRGDGPGSGVVARGRHVHVCPVGRARKADGDGGAGQQQRRVQGRVHRRPPVRAAWQIGVVRRATVASTRRPAPTDNPRMATSLLLLLDDIASVLDDVSAMTKVAVKKTAGVLGDDLALNAKQVSGVSTARELPVVWAVARGSAINKLILVPAALAIGWFVPWAVTPLLMAGGAYLCYEGAEKVLHKLLHAGAADHASNADEPSRIAGAIRTDFILSAEIIVITLGVVAGRPFVTQLAVLLAISTAMTFGVYGLVAGIVKLDDLGLMLVGNPSAVLRVIGRGILAAAPWLMRGLSFAGTAAMFLVGGGIVAHGIPSLHEAAHDLAARLGGHAAGGIPWEGILSMATDAVTGFATGAALVAVVGVAGMVHARVRGAGPSTGVHH